MSLKLRGKDKMSAKKRRHQHKKASAKPEAALKVVAKKATGTGLEWIPIDDFYLIPPPLVEQIEGRDYEVARLYELAPVIKSSSDCILGVFVDQQHVIQGFMWAGVNPLALNLTVYALSVYPAYQRRGIVAQAHKILLTLVEELGLVGYTFYTKTPDRFQGVGCVATGLIQMRGK